MGTEQAVTPSPAGVVPKLSVPTLTAMVVGSMVGAGVFSLPARFGVTTGILGSVLAPARLLYIKARSERGRRLFTPAEIGLFVLILMGAAVGSVGLWTGRIAI